MAILLPDGTQWLQDPATGLWRHIPDPDTAAALGVDENALDLADSLPGDTGPDWPSVDAAPPLPEPSPSPSPPPPPPPAPTPQGVTPQVPTSGGTFQWGGQTWGSGDLAKFVGYLAAHGTDFSVWAINHPDAAAILTGPPTDPSREPVPKSVGEALGAAISNGATPEQAAAQTEALAESQVAQGFGAPTGAALVQAAQDVQDAYVAAGGVPSGGSGAAVSAPVAGGPNTGPVRDLLGVTPAFHSNLFDPPKGGVTSSWHALLRTVGDTDNPVKGGIPAQHAALQSTITRLKGLW